MCGDSLGRNHLLLSPEVVLQDTLHGWDSKKHTAVADVLPGTSVDCRLIRNNYDTDDYTPEEADAVARLSYYCGMAAKMNWGENESGANIKNLVAPLKRRSAMDMSTTWTVTSIFHRIGRP